MATERSFYAHSDDRADLQDEDLAGKVLRYIRYVTLIDTSDISVMAIGRTIVLSGTASCETEIGCVEEATAAVIGVHLIENQLEVRKHRVHRAKLCSGFA
ncbi:osmotically-inducible protein OsmY [Pararhizobium capsulatum DSM 1112]|uniref:Osmotically-inducible protein OsmY n=1 Tax=Pararhizobium capsulatum DSM 1112 TaxID=1121113 RepID=A0ABU0BJJ7_9HYPH|nr:BON domain-containing protein [Pararhizobium capsulatum]MDQ0318435.1 osmotically-inducible protein OsmY [Pararhizobium capsulatum DSM 1112]